MTAGQREAAVHSLAVLLGAWLNGRTTSARRLIGASLPSPVPPPACPAHVPTPSRP